MISFDIITIFPEIFRSYFGESIIRRAVASGKISVAVHDLRKWARNKHRKVDDTPYGGGAGMVLMVQPIVDALRDIKKRKLRKRIILFSAKGKRFTQKDAMRLKKYDQLILICGRYEGVDERIAEYLVDEELSLGDFVLTGGEIPAMAVVDAVSRLVPGVLGNAVSVRTESHSRPGYLEYPQYTKPENFEGMKVPPVLLSGNHARTEEWRRKKAKMKKN